MDIKIYIGFLTKRILFLTHTHLFWKFMKNSFEYISQYVKLRTLQNYSEKWVKKFLVSCKTASNQSTHSQIHSIDSNIHSSWGNEWNFYAAIFMSICFVFILEIINKNPIKLLQSKNTKVRLENNFSKQLFKTKLAKNGMRES